MKALKLEGTTVTQVEIENTLEALQEAVFGYIECVTIASGRAVMIVNEEGLLRDTYQKQMNEGIAKARKEAQAPDIGELWRALDTALDNAIEAIEDFFDDYDSHPKIKNYANALKKTVRDLNTMVNNVLVGEK